jgi:hypothetical protein
MKRIEYGEPIIPVIFCIDATNKTITWNCDSENITAKNKIVLCDGRPQQMNTVITHAEIRIAYKLCSHEGVSLKIQNAAQKTFKFVKVEETNYKWKLVLVKAPWQAEDFSSKWQARMAISEGEKKVKAKNWIGQLREQEEAFFLAREQIMRPIASAKEENLEPAAASVAPEALDAQMGASSLVMIPPVPRQQNSSKKPAWYSCFACSAALEA